MDIQMIDRKTMAFLATGYFTPEQLGRLTPEQLGRLTPYQLGRLTPEQLGRLTPYQLGRLTPEQLAGLTPDQLGRLTPDQLGRLTPDQLGGLTPYQLAGLTPDQLGGLTPYQLAGLTPEQLGRLTPYQLGRLTPVNVPKVEKLYTRMLADINGLHRTLAQSTFGPQEGPGEARLCDTPMCIAGHTVHLAGEAGYELKRRFGFSLAATLIHRAACPGAPVPRYDTYPDEWALAFIEERAAEERG